MRISEPGLNLIRQHEGCRLEAYKDSAGVWTIGFGSTRHVHEGMKITLSEADDRLEQDVKVAEDAIARHVTVSLKQSQWDALVSFVFNVGVGAFADSTLLQELNAGNELYVPRELTRWVHAGGKPLKGLARRRVDEAALFLRD